MLEGFFNRKKAERRSDAEAASRVAEGPPLEEKRPGWMSLLLEAAGRQ